MAHDVAYQNLLLRRRTELHQRAGTVLEGMHGTQPARLEDLEALGHHFSHGEDRERGARYLVSAGDWARGIYANEDALRYYARALAILESGRPRDEPALAAIREHMGDLLGPIGRRDEARAQFDTVLAWARAGAHTSVRSAHAAQARRPALGRRRARAQLRAACARDCGSSAATADAVAIDVDTGIELAHLCQEMGRLSFRTGDNQEAVDWTGRALQQAERAAGLGQGDA